METGLPAAAPFVESSSTPSSRAVALLEARPAPEEAPPPPEPTDPRSDWLRGIVVDAEGTPIAGATVALVRTPSSDNTFYFQRDPGFHARLERAAETRSDADGRFAMRLARGIPFDLEAEAPERSSGFLPFVQAGEDVRVTLGLEHAVHGRLTRERDGTPVAGALVRVFTWPSYASREAHSASDGAYRVSFPFGGALHVEVLPLEEGATQWTYFELGPDGEEELDFVLPAGVAIVGRVTETQGGRPISGAIVGEGWEFRRCAVTDADGRYRLGGVGGPGAYGLAAKAKGHGMVKRMELPSAVDGVIQVDFELPLAWTAAGRVVDDAGAPVGNALITAGGSFHDADGQRLEHSSCRSDADGRFRIEDLSRGLGTHGFTVNAPGFARHHGRLSRPVEGSGETILGEIVLTPPVLVAGRILAADGRPLFEAEVIIQGHDSRSTWTDPQGRFAFGDLEPGSYVLKASWNSRAARPDVELTLADDEIREGLELRVPRGETLSGRVVDERGAGLGGVNVTAELYEARVAAEEPEEHAYFYETTDETGSFRFEDLLAGEYHIGAFPRGRELAGTSWLDGHARAKTGAPIEIVLVEGAPIRGRVLDAAGSPLLNFTVTGHGPEGRRTLAAGTDAQGRFELLVERDAVLDLVVSGPWQGADAEKPLWVERGVTAGTQGVELRLSPR